MKNTMKSPVGIAVLLFTLAVAGCGQKSGTGGGDASAASGGHHKGGGGQDSIPVTVASVQTGNIARTVSVTGSIAALQDVQLSARAAGRVTVVAAREGDLVRAGQLLVQQDATDLIANVQQQQANVLAAQAKLSQAHTNYQIGVTQAQQAILQAKAQVASAQQNYLKLKGGSRPQQVLQGQASVAQAQANFQNAQTNLQRYQTLYQQGAVAKADLDTAQTTFNVDQQLLKNAQASLSLTQAGYQQEDISAAQSQVRQQQANLANAVANEKNIALRRDDILAAQASVAQAKAQLTFAQQQVANASIRSPIDGIVAARETEPGQIASPGTNLLRVVNVNTVYYEPTVSETDFVQTHVGDPVQVQVDALPGKSYGGRVVAVYPAASASNRVFSLRVNVPNPTNDLRPGMFARGSVQTEVHRNVVLVPVTALVTVQQSALQVNTSSSGDATGGASLPPQQAFIVGPGNKAVARPLTLGIISASKAEVVSGLKAGDSLITTGQNLVQPGQAVSVISGPGAKHAQVAAL